MRLSFVGLLSVFHVLVSAAIYAQEPSSLSLSVFLSKKGSERYSIEIQLKNTSDQKATVQNLDLPWIPPNEMIFVNKAYRLDKAHAVGKVWAYGGLYACSTRIGPRSNDSRCNRFERGVPNSRRRDKEVWSYC